jgi:hypothetical protein
MVSGLLLLAALAALLVYGWLSDGYTNDEILYIGAGYRQAALGDHRLNTTQPPLAQRMIAWGLTGLSPRVPEFRAGEDVLLWCRRFVEQNGATRLLRRARVPSMLLTLGLAVAIWIWARSLGGPAAGLLALALAAFHPSLLAHGHLATTDLPAALAMFLASWAFWRWCQAPSAARGLLVAMILALGVVTRLTVWLLLPTFIVLLLLRRGQGEGIRVRAVALLLAIAAVVVPLTIWIVHDLRSAPWAGESVLGPTRSLPFSGQVVEWLRRLRLLPEAYLEAARFQIEHNATGHPAYLLGQHSKTGWRHYFLVAFLVKNTLGFLLALTAVVVLRWKKRGAPLAAGLAWHTLLPPAVVFLAVSAGHIQIGERYLLPIYPYLIVFAALTLTPLLDGRKGRIAVLALVGLHAFATIAVARRGYLAYFNALAGGPDGGHRLLLDSNLDWGQDLPRLADWMRHEGVDRIQLGYHGVDDPDRYGIRHEDLPGWHLYRARPPAEPFRGIVAVSPNLLFGLLPRLGDPYAALRERPPDERAGVFFIYRIE